ncbi:MAG: Rpn family recombination-promoting nuclease/putative transposase [Lachnospiraceae bacterium]|nr:Rpn family recombination-promoting nuclease/putative transposase [Lachnospiraceae bacterium]
MNQKPKRTLQELDLLDRFLFDATMEDPDAYEALLEILLGEEIQLLTPPETEKEFRVSPLLRSIRVDVYSMDRKKRVFQTEAQKENTHNLPKRSRYYQSLMDTAMLEPGCVDFNLLKDTYIIMIAPFDLFGQGKYRYTFRMTCEESEELELQDGAKRIFFNTKGKNKDEVSPELIELLEYMEKTTKHQEVQSQNEKIRIIKKRVSQVKLSEEMGVRYMQAWEEKAMEREAGRKEGYESGQKAGYESGQKAGYESGHESGQQEGKALVNELNQRLIQDGRMEDLLKSCNDSELQKLLLIEYGVNGKKHQNK